MVELQVEPLDLKALQNGDPIEQTRFVEMFSDRIYRLALKMLANTHDAEDVLQETFIKALNALPGFEGRSSLSTWLYRIAVNESLMLLRKKKPEASIQEDDYVDLENEDSFAAYQILDWCCLPENVFMTNETRAILDQKIQKLPENLRAVFILRDIEDLSIRETAETLDLSETNVKTRLFRARLKLREELSTYFGEFIQESTNG